MKNDRLKAYIKMGIVLFIAFSLYYLLKPKPVSIQNSLKVERCDLGTAEILDENTGKLAHVQRITANVYAEGFTQDNAEQWAACMILELHKRHIGAQSFWLNFREKPGDPYATDNKLIKQVMYAHQGDWGTMEEQKDWKDHKLVIK